MTGFRRIRNRAHSHRCRMTSLQLGLIIGGVVLVVGVLIYNWVQERRVRRRIAAAFRKKAGGAAPAATTRGEARVEPTLAAAVADEGDATRRARRGDGSRRRECRARARGRRRRRRLRAAGGFRAAAARGDAVSALSREFAPPALPSRRLPAGAQVGDRRPARAARSRHRVRGHAATGAAGRRRRAGRGAARAGRQAVALVRPRGAGRAVAAAQVRHRRANGASSPRACCSPTAPVPRPAR